MTEKQAQLSRLIRPAVGAAAGGGLGYFATPHLFGYSDVPEARRISGLSDAALGAILGIYGNRLGGFRALGRKALNRPLFSAGTVAGTELGPQLMAVGQRQQAASQAQTAASESISDAAKSVSIPGAIQNVMQSGPARGAVAGAATAGLAALLTGLLRRKQQAERVGGSSRQDMIRADFLKYLLPALIAGGVAGSFTNPSRA